ncbi:50S ribosomal protein L30e [Candidatus Micrarchaeota archaeon]|nr:50S ribosomal protein L30e [Candidatus Micrarchaeota archaeon]MBI5176953.1 50S ribosomal protein L30e [Candidatus Micrarchaeota archaeon]
MDVSRSIRLAVDSGRVVLGSQKAVTLVKSGGCKLLVLSQNAPADLSRDITHYAKMSGIPLIVYEGTSIELGAVCGKPFTVSALCVLDEGNSDILKASRGA